MSDARTATAESWCLPSSSDSGPVPRGSGCLIRRQPIAVLPDWAESPCRPGGAVWPPKSRPPAYSSDSAHGHHPWPFHAHLIVRGLGSGHSMATASVVSMGDTAVQKTEPFGPGESMQIPATCRCALGFGRPWFQRDGDRAMTTTAASRANGADSGLSSSPSFFFLAVSGVSASA